MITKKDKARILKIIESTNNKYRIITSKEETDNTLNNWYQAETEINQAINKIKTR